ncbi:MAG: hypothetical protein JNL01_16155 [Bdellovibrionales bacterium]|nr:hypothetical protein [Bdellovibrionales bacterium]
MKNGVGCPSCPTPSDTNDHCTNDSYYNFHAGSSSASETISCSGGVRRNDYAISGNLQIQCKDQVYQLKNGTVSASLPIPTAVSGGNQYSVSLSLNTSVTGGTDLLKDGYKDIRCSFTAVYVGGTEADSISSGAFSCRVDGEEVSREDLQEAGYENTDC